MTGRPTILVVDDDAFIRRPLEFILRKEGFDPISADGAPECMKRLSTHHPDLIILDVMMPDTDGFELCRAIRAEQRYVSIPIIMLSARGLQEDRDHGRDLGVADFLTKPYSPSQLLSRVRQLLPSA